MASNSTKVAQIRESFQQENAASWIADLWDTYNNQRQGKREEWEELQKYLFATDTSTTSNQSLPWKNSTTIPKLCHIRDNLHSNYLSALFPNDNWLTWNGYDESASTANTAKLITGYMSNKSREGKLEEVISKCLLDYIDYGNAFAMPSFERRFNMVGGEQVVDFIGPTAVRIHPLDIVFNPLADSFDKTFKIVRSVKTMGELVKLAEEAPGQTFWAEVISKRMDRMKLLSGFKKEDFSKAVQISCDGFGNYYEYLQSQYVEILEFYGDYYSEETGLSKGRRITITDRAHIAQDIPVPTYEGRDLIQHAGWRERSGNLWAMGPLDNLVGLQYRLDHLENAKADAFDLAIQPPLKIIGEVEEFDWGPSSEIHIDENGDVQEVLKNLNAIISSASEMEAIEMRMELYAGAPREAMGIRSPGEKTAFEVQLLDQASSRIFQAKINQFEKQFLEPLLNGMLEEAHRNMDMPDLVRTFDNDLNATEFTRITKDQITAKGVLRPIGARHFSQQANQLQNLLGIINGPMTGQLLAPHISAKEFARFTEDVTDIRGYKIFRPNVAIMEQKETASLTNQAQEDFEVEASVDVGGIE